MSDKDVQPPNCMRIIRMLLPWREHLATAFGTFLDSKDGKQWRKVTAGEFGNLRVNPVE